MTASIRIQADIVSDSKYWDNELGWVNKDKVLESGYIFQSDTFLDDEVLSLLEKCDNVWDDGNFMHGFLAAQNIIAGVFIWLDNPKLDEYPLLDNSEKYLAQLGV